MGGPERAVVAGRVDPAVVVVGAHDVVNGPTVGCERAHTLLTPDLGGRQIQGIRRHSNTGLS